MTPYDELPDIGRGTAWPHKCFLILGEWLPIAKVFLEAGFKGVMVVPPTSKIQADDPEFRGMELVKINLGPDQHFRKLLTGEYVKATTIKEVFDRWGGPFDVIAINLPAQTRQTWYADKIQDALPQMYILPEDGHNEYVLEKAMFRGYMKKITSMEDLLILVHK